MNPYGRMASPLLTRLLSALIAAIFVAGVGGLFVIDEGEANLPIGEPADTNLGLGTDNEFDYEPGESYPSGVTSPTVAPDSGITGGTGTSISVPPSGPGTAGRPTATTTKPAGSSTATTAAPRPAPSSGVGPTTSTADPGIYSIQPDGKGLYRVVPGGTGFPTWSPDGSRIAFAVPTSNPRYMIADSDGGARYTLAGGQIGSPPAFSPDSKRVYFSLGNGSGYDVHSVSATGTGLQRLSTRGDVSGVAVSANGQIAFISGGDVWTVAPDGGGGRVLVDSERAYRAVTFSDDGSRIAWYAADKIWTANADGTGARSVADTEGRVLEWNDITWAPDGTRLAFRSGTGGASRVRVVGFDGSGLHTAAEDAQAADWSPAGNRLAIFTAGAVRSNGDRDAHLELADPDRATFRQRVLDDSAGVIQSSGPRYSRDGSRLVFSTGGLDRGGPNPPNA
ncbi:MAG TPA: hypothetical protein VMY88_03300 [Acidimicrobiales bacterium]|nr:hypothetical protein [Acidimicrobiales bacterium]